MLLPNALPGFSKELERLLHDAGRPELARQCMTLDVAEPCGCGDSFCGGFYTGPKPNGAWGPDHENVVLDPKTGDVILDVVSGKIRFVEVLDRDDVRNKIRSLFAERPGLNSE